MDEDAGQTARATIEILVRTPSGKIHLVFVELQVDVAGRVGQVPAGQSAYVVQSLGDSGNGVHLSGQEVHPSDHAQCQRVPGGRNGCLEGFRRRGFFGSRVDNNQVFIRIKAALTQM